MGAIPGSREPSPSSTGLGPSGFDPERVKAAIKKLRADFDGEPFDTAICRDVRLLCDIAEAALGRR